MRPLTEHEHQQASALADKLCAEMAAMFPAWMNAIGQQQQAGACPPCDRGTIVVAAALTFAVAIIKNGHASVTREQAQHMFDAQWGPIARA